MCRRLILLFVRRRRSLRLNIQLVSIVRVLVAKRRTENTFFSSGRRCYMPIYVRTLMHGDVDKDLDLHNFTWFIIIQFSLSLCFPS